MLGMVVRVLQKHVTMGIAPHYTVLTNVVLVTVYVKIHSLQIQQLPETMTYVHAKVVKLFTIILFQYVCQKVDVLANNMNVTNNRIIKSSVNPLDTIHLPNSNSAFAIMALMEVMNIHVLATLANE